MAVCTALVALITSPGCERSERPTTDTEGVVVVYTALDREFSEPLLSEFTKRTGIRVDPVFDAESTKTIGLVNRIRAEVNRPRCDVFWNNEIVNTVRLKNEGLLAPCFPPAAADYDPRWKDPDGYWYGFAARARVLIVNTTLVSSDRMPSSILDLGDPAWSGRTAVARPLFGTTASHIACLHAALGAERFRRLLSDWKANRVAVLSGNKACAESVGSGRYAFALTDTDDAIAEVDAGRPVQIIFPDVRDDQMGTLVLPNTLAMVRGAPHPRAAQRLIDYLLSPPVETALAAGPSAQFPLGRSSVSTSRAGDLRAVRAMDVDLAGAAAAFDAAARIVEQTLLP